MNRRDLLLASAFVAAVGALPAVAQESPSTVARVKSRGMLLAGVKFDTPPFGFLDDNNEPAGFDLDIMRAVAAHIGVRVEFQKVTSVTRIPLLVGGQVDLVAAS